MSHELNHVLIKVALPVVIINLIMLIAGKNIHCSFKIGGLVTKMHFLLGSAEHVFLYTDILFDHPHVSL